MSAREGYKGHEELIRVWPRVRRERAGLRLVFIGDGDDRPRLQTLAGPNPDGIEFLGASGRALRKLVPDRGPLGPGVMFDRLEIELLLAAEGRVEARRTDAHGVAPERLIVEHLWSRAVANSGSRWRMD